MWENSKILQLKINKISDNKHKLYYSDILGLEKTGLKLL